MKFKDIELDFDIFDADTADAYDDAVEAVKASAAKVPGESYGVTIRRQCNGVFDFFDDLFGDGFHKTLFGERTNLLECIEVFGEFSKAISAQKTRIDALMNEVKADKVNTAPNRAARRVASRATKE